MTAMIPAGPESYRYVFGYRLRLARQARGLSMRELIKAMPVEISVNALSKFERGEMYPNTRVLVALAQTLDVSIDYLLSHHVRSVAFDPCLS